MKIGFLLLFILLGCNSKLPEMTSISGFHDGPKSKGNVSVVVSNLQNNNIKVTLNGTTELIVNTDGTYFFDQHIPIDTEYEAKVEDYGNECTIENPKGEIKQEHVLNVRCAKPGTRIRKLNIYGNYSGTIKLKHTDSRTQELQVANTNTLVFESDTATSTLEVIQQPPTEFCYFKNNLNATTVNGLIIDLYCGTFSNQAFGIKVSGQASPGVNATVQIRNSENADIKTITFTDGTPSQEVEIISSAKRNRKYILEIVSITGNASCSFLNPPTGSQLGGFYYLLIPEGNHNIPITCKPRSPCQTNGLELPTVDKTLNDITCSQDKFLMGGDFRKVGKQYGYLATDAFSGLPTVNTFDRVYGKVNKIVPDGRDGFFIVGKFNQVGITKRSNVVRVDEKHIIDDKFSTEVNGEVKEAFVEDDKLYLIGNFTSVKDAESNEHTRMGFAKIDFSVRPEKVSKLQLPDLGIHSSPNISASLIDWDLYIHANQKSIVINKVTGQLEVMHTGASDNGNTLYWKRWDNKVWMINKDLGMVDPRLPLNIHPSSGIIARNNYYTLIDDLLLQSDNSRIEQVDLISMNVTDFKTGAMAIKGAGVGFSGNYPDICFLPYPGTDNTIISTSTRKGMACFGRDGSMRTINPNFSTDATFGLYHRNRYYLNSQFFRADSYNSLVAIDAKTNLIISNWNKYIDNPIVVNSLSVDANEKVTVGGISNMFLTCNNCRNVFDLLGDSTPFTPEAFPLPIEDEVKKIISSDNIYAGITKNLGLGIFTNYPTAILPGAEDSDDIFIFERKVIHQKNEKVYIHELDATNTFIFKDLFDYDGPIARVDNNLYMLSGNQRIKIHNLDNSATDEFATYYPFEKVSNFSGVGNNVCYKDREYISCYNTTTKYQSLSKTIIDNQQNVFKEIAGSLFIATGFGSVPIVLTPNP